MQDYKTLEETISEMPELSNGDGFMEKDKESMSEELEEISQKINRNSSLAGKIYSGIKNLLGEFISTIYTPNLAERRDKTVKNLYKSKQLLNSKLKTSTKTVKKLNSLESDLNDKLRTNRTDLSTFQKYLNTVDDGIVSRTVRSKEEISIEEEETITKELRELKTKKREVLGKLSVICSGIKTSHNLLKRTEAQRIASENIHYVISERLAAVGMSYEYMQSTDGIQDYVTAIKTINEAKINLDSAEIVADQFDEYLGQSLNLINIDMDIFPDNGELNKAANASWQEKEARIKQQLTEVSNILGGSE